MKRVVASVLLVALIVVSCCLMTAATQNKILLAAIILLCVVGLIKVNLANKKKTGSAEKGSAQRTSEKVYVFDGGRSYHSYYSCQYVYAKDAKQIDKAEAKAKGLKPCKKCYPYGD